MLDFVDRIHGPGYEILKQSTPSSNNQTGGNAFDEYDDPTSYAIKFEHHAPAGNAHLPVIVTRTTPQINGHLVGDDHCDVDNTSYAVPVTDEGCQRPGVSKSGVLAMSTRQLMEYVS